VAREATGDIEGGVIVFVLSFFVDIFLSPLKMEEAGAMGKYDLLVLSFFFAATLSCKFGAGEASGFIFEMDGEVIILPLLLPTLSTEPFPAGDKLEEPVFFVFVWNVFVFMEEPVKG